MRRAVIDIILFDVDIMNNELNLNKTTKTASRI